jgi:DNA-binding transcriptional ArsR family regulator
MTPDAFQETADLIKLLAHPARLQILEVLDEEGEACVCHMEWRLGLRQATISQHLARLREAGIVTDCRQGFYIFYALASVEIANLLRSVKQSTRELSVRGLRHELPVGDSTRACPCPRCKVET